MLAIEPFLIHLSLPGLRTDPLWRMPNPFQWAIVLRHGQKSKLKSILHIRSFSTRSILNYQMRKRFIYVDAWTFHRIHADWPNLHILPKPFALHIDSKFEFFSRCFRLHWICFKYPHNVQRNSHWCRCRFELATTTKKKSDGRLGFLHTNRVICTG